MFLHHYIYLYIYLLVFVFSRISSKVVMVSKTTGEVQSEVFNNYPLKL